MARFIVYDLAFMILVTLAVIIFIKTRHHNLKRQGWMYLYHTKLGLRALDWTAKKFAPVLGPLQYVVILVGYVLMVSILWLIGATLYLYLKYPIFEVIKAPPIFPLIPYFPALFDLEAFFPPFYFTYFIIALIIVAVSHEFAHGVFARLNKIRIKSTGFAFLGPILGAFVEQDEKQMNRAKPRAQLAVLGAGVFANIIMTLFFGILLWIFFASAFNPAGVYFNTYSQNIINISDIAAINGMPLTALSLKNLSMQNNNFTTIAVYNKTYYADPQVLKKSLIENYSQLVVIEDTPAFRARLSGAITSINGLPILSQEQLRDAIRSYRPGENVSITTFDNKQEKKYSVTLAEKEGNAFLGIGVMPRARSRIFGWFYDIVASVKDPLIYYKSSLGSLGTFIYDMLWWIVIINFFVALFNMLPLGILDGGRFFYLTIVSITGSERIGRGAFRVIGWIIGLLFLVLMVRWITGFF